MEWLARYWSLLLAPFCGVLVGAFLVERSRWFYRSIRRHGFRSGFYRGFKTGYTEGMTDATLVFQGRAAEARETPEHFGARLDELLAAAEKEPNAVSEEEEAPAPERPLQH
jgi:hypothetical protein